MAQTPDHTLPFTILLASGKGGVGKSVIAANLSAALANDHHPVLLVDANLHAPTLHVLFAADPPLRLHQYDPQHHTPEQLLHSVSPQLDLLAGLPGAEKPDLEIVRDVLRSMQQARRHKIIVIDTASGITPELLTVLPLSHLLLLITTDEPTAIVDTYGLLKYLVQQQSLPLPTLLVNMVVDPEDARQTEQTLNAATQRFLNLHIPMIGFVPYDRTVRRSILNQTLLLQFDPFAASTQAILQLSQTLFRFIESVEKPTTAA